MLVGHAMAEKVPRLVAGVDVRKFKLDPLDGFVLTRIDGRLGVKDLAHETGLPAFSVEQALEKLEKLGVVERVDPNAPPRPPAPAPATPAAPAAEKPTAVMPLGVAAKYDPKELEQPADLGVDQKKRILDYFYRLDDFDHYTLLGVTKDAEKKAVKRAYYELAGYFHPDRYFKKNLGVFKPKMEVLFTRITEAHDTLVDAAKRAEYDAYLNEVATTRGLEAMLERAIAEAKPLTAPPPQSVAPPEPPPEPVRTESRPIATPSPADLQARREALARRLTGGAPSRRPSPGPGPRVTAPPAPADPRAYATANDAVDALKRRYEQRVEGAAQAQVQKHVQAAEQALAKNDVVAAASALGLAVQLAPDDAGLVARHRETKAKADALLAESYQKQAEYEERAQRWVEAARNWQRVAGLKVDDARAHERAAHAILRCPSPDLHRAAEYAKQAIALAPRTIENHLALVETYAKAGLTASARRAAEAAEKIDPNSVRLQELVKRIGKPSSP